MQTQDNHDAVALFEHLVGVYMRRSLSTEEWKRLVRFGATYGSEAAEQKYWSMLKKKGVGQEEFYAEVRRMEQQAQQMVASYRTKRLAVGREPDISGRAKVAKGSLSVADRDYRRRMGKVLLPLLRSLAWLRFWDEVVLYHFTDAELQRLADDYAGKEEREMVEDLTKRVEEKTGRPIGEVMREIFTDCEHSVADIMVGTIEELVRLHAQGRTRDHVEALQKGDVAGVLRTYYQPAEGKQ